MLTRERILETVWGFAFEPASNSLDVYVMYLRRKTEAGGLPRL
ncbi:MAG: winged helix-turn-helix domain-containing protein, partial [Actinomadura sp.]